MRKPILLSELKKRQKQELKKLTRPNKKTFERFERQQNELKQKQKKYKTYQRDKREYKRTLKKEYEKTKKAIKGKTKAQISEIWKGYNYTKQGLKEDLQIKRVFIPYSLNNVKELSHNKLMTTYNLEPDYAMSLQRFFNIELKNAKEKVEYILLIGETEQGTFISESFAFWEFKKYATTDPNFLINNLGEKMVAFKSDDSQEIVKYYIRTYTR